MAPALIEDCFFGSDYKHSLLDSHERTQPIHDLNAPIELQSMMAWKSTELREEDYIKDLFQAQELEEIGNALNNFKEADIDVKSISQSNFELPSLAPRLTDIARSLYNGRGFAVLRGLDTTKYTVEDNITIFAGISCYIGNKRGHQYPTGNVLVHIQDSATSAISQSDRPAMYSNSGLNFHCDMWADILALQALSCASTGGSPLISPAYTVYNEMGATRPDLLRILMSPIWSFHSRTLHYKPAKRPLISYHEGRVLFNFGRFRGFGATILTSDLDSEQQEALNCLHEMAERHQLALKLQPGDLCYVNNFALLHSREPFEDSASKRRHFVRMWLKNESLAWKLPLHLERGNRAVFFSDKVSEIWEFNSSANVELAGKAIFAP